MRLCAAIVAVVSLLLGSGSSAMASAKLVKNDFTTWLGADARQFGCFLDKEFQYKDKKFNCGLTTYKNYGDPCRRVEEYVEGPQFPQDKVQLVDRRIKALELTWEHGELQELDVTLNGKFSENGLRKIFNLSKGASVQDCSAKDTCIVLIGFDHVGAGEVECGEPRDKRRPADR